MIPFPKKAIIKGIKWISKTKSTDANEFYEIKLTTYENKPIYTSGKGFGILWDIMDIPHVDEYDVILLSVNLTEIQRLTGELEIFYIEREDSPLGRSHEISIPKIPTITHKIVDETKGDKRKVEVTISGGADPSGLPVSYETVGKR